MKDKDTFVSERERPRITKDISLKKETQGCTTNADIPPRKPEF